MYCNGCMRKNCTMTNNGDCPYIQPLNQKYGYSIIEIADNVEQMRVLNANQYINENNMNSFVKKWLDDNKFIDSSTSGNESYISVVNYIY